MSGDQPSPGEGHQLLPEEQLSTAHQQIPGKQEGYQLLPEEQLSTAHQQIPGTAEGDQLITGTKDQFNPGTEMLEEPQDSVSTLERILPTEQTVHGEQTIPEGDCGQVTRSGNGP